MTRTNRNWLPEYCNPDSYLPKIPETRTLFSRPPFLFQDFAGRAIRFLQSEQARKMGFEYDQKNILPCKWKCADESVFGMDLALYAYTGHYPFDKGGIGGYFNEPSVSAAVHHGRINIDFGGSHVGYLPDNRGGLFGYIWRPLQHERSTDCGHLMNVIQPFKSIYDDATESILIFNPGGDRLFVSIPNEFIQPNWSSHSIKLLVDLDTLTAGDVPYREEVPHTHTPIGRTLFYLNPRFLEELSEEAVRRFHTAEPTPIGNLLTHPYFSIFDSAAELDLNGLPVRRLNLYMKFILSAANSPYPLKAAIVNTNIEHNRLTDTVRQAAYKPYAFASFTGVIIDVYEETINNYVNLFQPLGFSIKPAGVTRDIELPPDEIHHLLRELTPAEPVRPVADIMGYRSLPHLLDRFIYRPGHFRRD